VLKAGMKSGRSSKALWAVSTGDVRLRARGGEKEPWHPDPTLTARYRLGRQTDGGVRTERHSKFTCGPAAACRASKAQNCVSKTELATRTTRTVSRIVGRLDIPQRSNVSAHERPRDAYS